MLKKIVKFTACLVLPSLWSGCVPDEDTSPSAALFPTTYFGEVRPDFTEQLTNRASREEVELHAVLGAHVDRGPGPVEDLPCAVAGWNISRTSASANGAPA